MTTTLPVSAGDTQAEVERFRTVFRTLKSELSQRIVGQGDILEGVLIALFAGGHVLLEGVPGLGKTLLVRTLADAMQLDFSRIQFTPDLMPADIVGTDMIAEDETGRKVFRFERGPVFAHLLLADEINRATPKTQSALLEAMQEQSVTVGGTRHVLEQPFLVLATQNPLEMEGTYPLPEAQLDRFFFKLRVEYPSAEELHEILDRTTGTQTPEVRKVIQETGDITKLRTLVRGVPVTREIQDYAVGIVMGTHPEHATASALAKKYVRYGASPRGAQSILLAAKIVALLDDRYHVSRHDISKVALPALRHRLILNFEGEAEGKTTDEIIQDLLEK